MSGEIEWPAIEYEDCYPVDEDFADWTAQNPPLSFRLAGEWLLRELPRAAEHMCCSCHIRRGKNIMGRGMMLVEFSTGGWSGAEAIIGLINRRVDLRHLMLSWQRGGHYVFEVPCAPVDVTETRSKAWQTRRVKYGPRGHSGSYAR